MYPAQLLTTLSLFALPLIILSAPAPAPVELMLPKGTAVYYIMRTSTDRNGGLLPSLTGNWVSKAFTATVKGDAEGAMNVICRRKSTWEGNAEDLSKQQTIGLDCTDGSVHVFVTTGSAKDAGETYSVQDRDLPAATTTIQPSCPNGTDRTVCAFMGPQRFQSA
ncbi:MAG: hypothetical protein Q9198_001694 [Flavoplaca austrocitrina]